MKYINCFVGFICMMSLCSIDSRSWWPTILFVASWVYLMVMAWRNGWFYEPEAEDEV